MHKDLKADYIIANPPSNDSDWSGELLRDRCPMERVGTEITAAASQCQLCLDTTFPLSPCAFRADFVLAKGSLTTKTSNEGEIRKAMVENDLIDCIVNLPAKLFLNTQIPACLWFLHRNKQERKGKILFIDARNMGFLINRKNRELPMKI